MSDPIECTISRLDAKGRGVAETTRGDVLVPFAVPGDVVRIAISGKRKGVWRGRIIESLTASPDRVAPRCPYVGTCGGCPWQMLDYASQLRAKRALVQRALAGLMVPEVPEVMPCPDIFYFRNRMDYAVGPSGELGLKASEQWWNVLDLSTCFLLSQDAVEVMARFRTWMQQHHVPPWDLRHHRGFARYLVIREGKRTGERMAFVITAPGALPAPDDLIARLKDLTTSIIWGVNETITDLSIAHDLHVLHGSASITERLDIGIAPAVQPLTFRIHPNAFFQTNTTMAEQLVATVSKLAACTGSELLVDLYCGVGVFGIALAHQTSRVIGVESDPDAIPAARQNAENNGVTNAKFELATAEGWALPFEDIDVLVVDPPRAGLHPRVAAKILSHRPARIVYVSCNPTALARDLTLLLPHYTCDAIRVLDLFPHSPHVETVVRLTKQV